jgi:cytochrome c oxidase subunit 4
MTPKRDDERDRLAHREERRIRQASFGRYLGTWIALTVLTFATFGLSHVHLGPFSVVVAMIIAVAKSLLVLLFFMHLWEERGAIPLTLAIAFSLLTLLIGLSIADVQTRFPPAVPRGGPEAGVAAVRQPARPPGRLEEP